MKPLTRRSVTIGLAAAMAAIPAVGLYKGAEGPSELAALARQYFAEVAAFNSSPDLGDDDFFHADQPFDVTLQQMVSVPVRSIEDALAAVEVVLHEGDEGCMIDLSSECASDTAAASCLHALRDYLAGRVA